jgi:hypothetical protein
MYQGGYVTVKVHTQQCVQQALGGHPGTLAQGRVTHEDEPGRQARPQLARSIASLVVLELAAGDDTSSLNACLKRIRPSQTRQPCGRWRSENRNSRTASTRVWLNHADRGRWSMARPRHPVNRRAGLLRPTRCRCSSAESHARKPFNHAGCRVSHLDRINASTCTPQSFSRPDSREECLASARRLNFSELGIGGRFGPISRSRNHRLTYRKPWFRLT